MKTVRSKGTFANVRERATTDSKVIDKLSRTSNAKCLGYTVVPPFKWYNIEINGKKGFVREDVCEVIEGKMLKYLVIHCTATPENREVTKEDIIRWHTNPVSRGGRGWKTVGYSRMINLKGDSILMHNYNENDIVEPWEVTNGASGINSVSRHIVYVGGTDRFMKPKDTRNEAQKETLKKYVLDMVKRYPEILVCGHYHFANKACPSFNVELWCKEIGVSEKNIFKK
jgi:N-acetylmuramoyl-L-alanine amidase